MFDADKLSKYMWVGVAALIIVIAAGVVIIKNRLPESAAVALKENKSFQPPPTMAEPEKTKPAATPVASAPPVQTPVASTVAPQPVAATPALPESAALVIGNVPGKIKVGVAQLKEGDRLPLDYTCYRKNASPPITWMEGPEGTKEYVVLFEKTPATEKEKARPDKLVHWAIYNITPTLSGLPRGIPKAPLLQNGIGQANAAAKASYIGPCQPKGKHEYKFRVFALDKALKLPGGVNLPQLYGAMNGHILDAGEFTVQHYYK